MHKTVPLIFFRINLIKQRNNYTKIIKVFESFETVWWSHSFLNMFFNQQKAFSLFILILESMICHKLSFILLLSLYCYYYSFSKEPSPFIDSLSVNDSIARAKRPNSQKLSKLSDLGIVPFSRNAQGMDIYNDSILFQAGIDQNYIHIIDINNFLALGTIQFKAPLGEPCHMNNINCGAKIEDSDLYPLLYLSQTNGSHSCFVIRINNDASSYEIIQTIKYTGKDHYYNGSAFDWFVDLDNNFIYTYGHYNGDQNKREIMKFHLPQIDLNEFLLSDEDIIDSFVLDNQSIYQGSKIINGLLYTPVGYGDSQHPSRLFIIDLKKKDVVLVIHLSCREPEAIGRYQSGAVISTGGADPYYFYLSL